MIGMARDIDGPASGRKDGGQRPHDADKRPRCGAPEVLGAGIVVLTMRDQRRRMPRLTVPAHRDGWARLAVIGLGDFELERPAGRMVTDFLRCIVLPEVKKPSVAIVGVLLIASDGDPGDEQKSVDHHRHRSTGRKHWCHSRNRSFRVIAKRSPLPGRRDYRMPWQDASCAGRVGFGTGRASLGRSGPARSSIASRAGP